MAGLVFDEQSLVDQSVYKYDQFLHSRINKYTGSGRTMVTYYNINDRNTTDSLGLNVHYQLLGIDSPLRYDKITKFPMLDLTPVKSNA